ncbi:MAG TPA: cytochrome P450 [Acidimicrobiales bacterium]|nr:cytochrome P450 [Acidimicrobiales bacterium]
MPDDLREVDLTDLDTFAGGFPHEIFRLHRAVAPVWWHRPTVHTPDGEGFWSVATYDEVLQVLNDPVTFSSETGGGRPYGGTIIQDLPVAGVVLNMMDDPRHARIRRLVSKGLTPAAVRGLEGELRRRMRQILATVGDECDFLLDVAAELPMQAICMLMGIPEADRHQLFEAVEHIFDIPDESDMLSMGPQRQHAVDRMGRYGAALIADKRAHPGDDMLSTVIHAELPDADAPRLSDDELSAFFSLLFSAGAETTRNAVAGAMVAFLEWPAELALLRAGGVPMASAVEEILRWTTPSPSKRRTATRACKLGGHVIEAGEKVVVWEGSANRDPRHFDRPDEFDLRRDPNTHLSFGHGVHFCLGAHLARLEIRVALEELLASVDGFALAGPVEWTRSNRHAGIRHLPLRLQRRALTAGGG